MFGCAPCGNVRRVASRCGERRRQRAVLNDHSSTRRRCFEAIRKPNERFALRMEQVGNVPSECGPRSYCSALLMIQLRWCGWSMPMNEVPASPGPSGFAIGLTDRPSHTLSAGGSTIIVDLSIPAIQYAIVKRIDNPTREARTAAFLNNALSDSIRAPLVAPNRREPFAALHSLADMVS